MWRWCGGGRGGDRVVVVAVQVLAIHGRTSCCARPGRSVMDAHQRLETRSPTLLDMVADALCNVDGP